MGALRAKLRRSIGNRGEHEQSSRKGGEGGKGALREMPVDGQTRGNAGLNWERSSGGEQQSQETDGWQDGGGTTVQAAEAQGSVVAVLGRAVLASSPCDRALSE